jgi:anti-sigma regulatory factor (Ser/Thr protein kinase)
MAAVEVPTGRGGPEPQGSAPFRHEALFYDCAQEFVDGTAAFVRAGLGNDEPVLVAVPSRRVEGLRAALGSLADAACFVDVCELGRNPARVIPAVRAFVDECTGTATRVVCESIWPGRTTEEVREAVRTEALINIAFASTTVAVLCPYNWSLLDRDVLKDAGRTHPDLLVRGERRRSVLFTDPLAVHAAADHPLAEPPPGAVTLAFGRPDLSALLETVWQVATKADVPTGRVRDLMYAASEVAMNTFRHGGGTGVLRTWPSSQHGGLVCEFRDSGRINDPMAGRRDPAASEDDVGRGLWLVNQCCDLVEIRSDQDGTTVRLHVRPA